MTSSEKEQRYFTTNPTRYGQVISILVLIGTGVAAAQPGAPLWLRAFALVNMALWGAFFLRTLRLGVYSSPEGLRIYNTFQTHELSWEQIEDITIGTTQWNGIAAIVECRDGRRIHCSGVQHPWMSTVWRAWQGRCGSMVERLQRDLARFG